MVKAYSKDFKKLKKFKENLFTPPPHLNSFALTNNYFQEIYVVCELLLTSINSLVTSMSMMIDTHERLNGVTSRICMSSFAQGHVPKVGQVVVNCDGSIKDNDSYSSCGGLVTDHFGSLW